jgi:hypothetical protein
VRRVLDNRCVTEQLILLLLTAGTFAFELPRLTASPRRSFDVSDG